MLSRLAAGKQPVVCDGCLSDQSVIAQYGSRTAFSVGIIRSFEQEDGAHQPNEYVACHKLVEFVKNHSGVRSESITVTVGEGEYVSI